MNLIFHKYVKVQLNPILGGKLQKNDIHTLGIHSW